MNIVHTQNLLIGHIEDTTYFEYQGYIYRLLEAVFQKNITQRRGRSNVMTVYGGLVLVNVRCKRRYKINDRSTAITLCGPMVRELKDLAINDFYVPLNTLSKERRTRKKELCDLNQFNALLGLRTPKPNMEEVSTMLKSSIIQDSFL